MLLAMKSKTTINYQNNSNSIVTLDMPFSVMNDDVSHGNSSHKEVSANRAQK